MKTRLVVAFVALVVAACGGTTNTPGPSDAGSATGGASGAGGTSGAGGAGTCTPTCGTARDCCAGHCANLQNDPLNCGKCGTKCDPGTYCGGGQCVTPPCQSTCSGTAQCCGTTCCAAGEICCDTQGPIPTGPACTAPIGGTCPMGCAPLCK